MAIYEAVHPLGKDVEKIYHALNAGLADRVDWFSGGKIALNYKDALGSGTGVSTAVIANWTNKSRTRIEFPVAIDEHDTTWIAGPEADFKPIKQRIMIRDMLGRRFKMRISDPEIYTPYLSFDLLEDGVVLSIQADETVFYLSGDLTDGVVSSVQGDENVTSFYGEFDDEMYMRLLQTANMHGSIGELAILADAV